MTNCAPLTITYRPGRGWCCNDGKRHRSVAAALRQAGAYREATADQCTRLRLSFPRLPFDVAQRDRWTVRVYDFMGAESYVGTSAATLRGAVSKIVRYA